jgi:aspartate aminotransferase-like enzyme
LKRLPRRSVAKPGWTLDVLYVIPHDKLFTPGPVEVSEKTLAAFARPIIGHRGEDFIELYREINPQLQTLFGTQQPVFLSTSSAWGVMEGAIRNLVRQRVLCCMCGAFSDKWLDVSQRCGKQAEADDAVGNQNIVQHGHLFLQKLIALAYYCGPYCDLES